MSERFYTKEHEWLEVRDEHTIRVGISAYAVEALGDIVYVDLPEEDDEVEAGEEFANVESVKSTSEVYAPVSGKVTAVNEELDDDPELVNEDCYGDGWFVDITSDEDVDTGDFLDQDAYDAYLETLKEEEEEDN